MWTSQGLQFLCGIWMVECPLDCGGWPESGGFWIFDIRFNCWAYRRTGRVGQREAVTCWIAASWVMFVDLKLEWPKPTLHTVEFCAYDKSRLLTANFNCCRLSPRRSFCSWQPILPAARAPVKSCTEPVAGRWGATLLDRQRFSSERENVLHKISNYTIPPRLWSHCRRSGANAAKHTGKPRYLQHIFPKAHKNNLSNIFAQYYHHIKDLKSGSKHEMPSLVRNGDARDFSNYIYQVSYLSNIICHMSMII